MWPRPNTRPIIGTAQAGPSDSVRAPSSRNATPNQRIGAGHTPPWPRPPGRSRASTRPAAKDARPGRRRRRSAPGPQTATAPGPATRPAPAATRPARRAPGCAWPCRRTSPARADEDEPQTHAEMPGSAGSRNRNTSAPAPARLPAARPARAVSNWYWPVRSIKRADHFQIVRRLPRIHDEPPHKSVCHAKHFSRALPPGQDGFQPWASGRRKPAGIA